MAAPRYPRDPLTAAVLRLADGDRSAFDAVYDAASGRIDAVCARILGPGADARDAAQQALVHVFERVDAFDPERGSALAWIVTVAAWEARTVRRRRGRAASREVGLAAAEERWAPSAEDPEREARAALFSLLDGVTDADREVILAAIGDQDRPDVPPATFRKRLQRAIERLRAGLGIGRTL